MIQTIIIDDEADARKALSRLLEKYCPEVEVIAQCTSGQEGLVAIQQHQPELVFLDVQMPHMTGFELLETLGNPPFSVIFTTAYDTYAIKAIKFSALDYLLKPIDIDDLRAAIRRFTDQQQKDLLTQQYQTLLSHTQQQNNPLQRLAIPTLDGMVFVAVADMIHCQADGSYTQIYLAGQEQMLVSKTLKEFEQLLSGSGFCRVHHASLINLKHIQKYVKGEGGYVILSEGYQVNVSRRRKEEFLRQLTIL